MTNHLETLIRSHEARTAADDATRRTASEALAAEIAEARAALAAAEAVPAELLAEIEAGADHDTHTLTEARDAIDVAAARLRGLESRAPRSGGYAPRNLAALSMVAPLFEGLLPGVPVITTNVPASVWLSEANESDAPAIVVAQIAETVAKPDGSIACQRMEATFIAPAWAAGVSFMSVEEIDKRASEAGIRLNLSAHAGAIDVIDIELDAAFDSVPVIRSLTPNLQGWAVHDMHARLGSALGLTGGANPNVSTIKGRLTMTQKLPGNAYLTTALIDVAEAIEDDARTLTVTVEIGAGGMDPQTFRIAGEDVLARLKGAAVSGIGRVASTSLELGDMDGFNAAMTLTVEYVSRVG